MRVPVVFYAWQNDRPRETTRDFIHQAADEAIRRIGVGMRVEDSPRLDHDTKNELGSPPIAETILRKIKHSAIILADLTCCSEIREEGQQGRVKKKNPNPNVMLELGYAAAVMGWNRAVLVMNDKYGGPAWLPFDLKNHRFPITYELGPNSIKGQEMMEGLVRGLEQQIRSCLMKEYDLVDATLGRLSSYSRRLMKECGHADRFWETEGGNMVLSRQDLAIMQMLELNMIRCVDVTSETAAQYSWTYLGRQCCDRLGIRRPVPFTVAAAAGAEIADPVFVDLSFYDRFDQQETACLPSSDEAESPDMPLSKPDNPAQSQPAE